MRLVGVLLFLFLTVSLFSQSGTRPNQIQGSPYKGGVLVTKAAYYDHARKDTFYIYQHMPIDSLGIVGGADSFYINGVWVYNGDTVTIQPDSLFATVLGGTNDRLLQLRDGSGTVDFDPSSINEIQYIDGYYTGAGASILSPHLLRRVNLSALPKAGFFIPPDFQFLIDEDPYNELGDTYIRSDSLFNRLCQECDELFRGIIDTSALNEIGNLRIEGDSVFYQKCPSCIDSLIGVIIHPAFIEQDSVIGNEFGFARFSNDSLYYRKCPTCLDSLFGVIVHPVNLDNDSLNERGTVRFNLDSIFYKPCPSCSESFVGKVIHPTTIDSTTVSSTATVTLTEVANNITATVNDGSITPVKLSKNYVDFITNETAYGAKTWGDTTIRAEVDSFAYFNVWKTTSPGLSHIPPFYFTGGKFPNPIPGQPSNYVYNFGPNMHPGGGLTIPNESAFGVSFEERFYISGKPYNEFHILAIDSAGIQRRPLTAVFAKDGSWNAISQQLSRYSLLDKDQTKEIYRIDTDTELFQYQSGGDTKHIFFKANYQPIWQNNGSSNFPLIGYLTTGGSRLQLGNPSGNTIGRIGQSFEFGHNGLDYIGSALGDGATNLHLGTTSKKYNTVWVNGNFELPLRLTVPTNANGWGHGITSTRYYFYDYTTSAEILTLRGTGRVGIGNFNPSYNLDVTGTVRATNYTGGTFSGYLGKDASGQIVDAATPDLSNTNELQTVSKSGTIVTLSNSGGSFSVADQDSSKTNELITSFTRVSDSLKITDPGGTYAVYSPIGTGTVTNVSATSPLFSSGGTTPNITIQNGSTSQSGAITSTDWNLFNNKVGGSGTLNYVPKWTGANTLSGTSQIFDSGSLVGIGTAAPGYKIDVNGTARIVTSLRLDWLAGSGSRMVITDNNGDISATTLPPTGSGTTNYMTKWSSSTALTNSQFFDNGTQVGLGFTTLYNKFNIDGDIGLYKTGGSTLNIGSEHYYSAGFYNKTPAIGAVVDPAVAIPASLAFYTYNGSRNERMRILGNGNVGIGTTTPGYKVEITGDIAVSDLSGTSTALIGKNGSNKFTNVTLGSGFSWSSGTLNFTETYLGTVTSIATGNGITGGTITSTGTLGLTGQALAFHNLGSNGFAVRTSSGNVSARSLVQGTGITITNTDGVSGNPTITNSAPDQTVSISGAGITNVTGTYPNFTITSTEVDGSPSNELQTISTSGAAGNITLSNGGGTLNLNVNDADASSSNEFNTSMGLSGTTIQITDGGGTLGVNIASIVGGYWGLSGTELTATSSSYNVGIGTTSTLYNKFNVVGDMGLYKVGSSTINIGSDAYNSAGYYNKTPAIGSVYDPTYAVAASLAFSTYNGNRVERMRILGNGNVGIGDSTPTYKLDIVGDLALTDFTGSTFAGYIGKDVNGQIVDAATPDLSTSNEINVLSLGAKSGSTVPLNSSNSGGTINFKEGTGITLTRSSNDLTITSSASDGNGIYDGSGSLSINTDVNANSKTFLLHSSGTTTNSNFELYRTYTDLETYNSSTTTGSGIYSEDGKVIVQTSVGGNIKSSFLSNTTTAKMGFDSTYLLTYNGAAKLKINNSFGTSGYYLTSGGSGSMSWTAPPAAATPVDIQTFTSGGTWTKPSGAKSITVVAIGGGGGGGSGSCIDNSTVNSGSGGGGGGAGGYSSATFDATSMPGTVSVTVGSGGGGGTNQTSFPANGFTGSSGGTSRFDNYLAASGGSGGGAGQQSTTSAGGASGIGIISDGGLGGGSANTATAGSNGSAAKFASGGGNGGAGVTTSSGGANSGATSPLLSNNSSQSRFGTGGTGGAAANPGGTGASYGGGGGGGGAARSAAHVQSGSGGTGGPGIVIVYTYF